MPVLQIILGESKIPVLCCRLSSNFFIADNCPLGILRGFHQEQDYVHFSGLRKAVGLF